MTKEKKKKKKGIVDHECSIDWIIVSVVGECGASLHHGVGTDQLNFELRSSAQLYMILYSAIS
jgi:hypothetical protein